MVCYLTRGCRLRGLGRAVQLCCLHVVVTHGCRSRERSLCSCSPHKNYHQPWQPDECGRAAWRGASRGIVSKDVTSSSRHPCLTRTSGLESARRAHLPRCNSSRSLSREAIPSGTPTSTCKIKPVFVHTPVGSLRCERSRSTEALNTTPLCRHACWALQPPRLRQRVSQLPSSVVETWALGGLPLGQQWSVTHFEGV